MICYIGNAIYQVCRAQTKRTNSHFGVVEESDFKATHTVYNSTFVSDEQLQCYGKPSGS